jgi:hypothetical protein
MSRSSQRYWPGQVLALVIFCLSAAQRVRVDPSYSSRRLTVAQISDVN